MERKVLNGYYWPEKVVLYRYFVQQYTVGSTLANFVLLSR